MADEEQQEQEIKDESFPVVQPSIVPEIITDAVVDVVQEPQKKGKLPLKYKMIAEYAARGYPVKLIASMLNIKEGTVYRILESSQEVWGEINRIVGEIFSEGDRLLANLYKKALVKLDSEMESPDAERRDKAIDKVLKCYGYNRDKEDPDKRPPIIAQFFGAGSTGPMVEDFDDMVKRKRKERGLKEEDE
jgi:hypothetical protein